MFTLSDICQIAIQIEQNGEAAYRSAGKSADDPEIARLFGILAEDERKHAQWFGKLDNLQSVAPKDDQIERMGRELLQNMMAQQTFSLDAENLSRASDINDAVNQSIEFENDTILFYELLHGFLQESEAMRKLELIINEERTHIDRLKEIARMLETNRQIQR